MRARWLQVCGWFERRGWSPAVALAYAAVVATFVAAFAQFYLPGKGFSYLIAFGSRSHLEESRLSKLRRIDYYVEKGSDGYDAQYYVQIAMDPSLQNKQLPQAVDSLPYRARRILLPALAHAMGLGEPAAILQAYALQNALAWLLLAALLLHWFPPRSWEDFIRWTGVLGTFGLCLSVRHALPDGPSLLLIAFGVFLLERGRPWLSIAVLALSGLAKETNLLGAAALIPRAWRPASGWALAAARALLIAAPLALWFVYISLRVGPAADAGYRNFDLPFAAYVRKWSETIGALGDISWAGPAALWSLVALVVLTVQFLFLVARPRWTEAWWRIGASFALLMIFLGDAVWEGFPGAASRVLLPMQLAFNVLVPSGRGWMALLIAGNLTLLAAPSVLRSPGNNLAYTLRVDSALFANAQGRTIRVEYSPEWHGPEQGSAGYRIWARESAALSVFNPHAFPLELRLRFEMNAEGARGIQLRRSGESLWAVTIPEGGKVAASLPRIVLAPGENRFEFVTDQPARMRPPDPRPLAFCVHNLRLDIEQVDAR